MSFSSSEDAVRALVAYGLRTGLITEDETIYTANTLFDILQIEPSSDFSPEGGRQEALEQILAFLLDDACSRGIIDDGIASRDLFDTRLMSALTPRPAEVIREFRSRYDQSPEEATDYFYSLSKDSDYIRTYRVRKDRKWKTSTEYGQIDITINLSKPEKDPKAIAAALSHKQSGYPKCLLCPQNQGYHGRLDHPARQTIRLIPLELDESRWYMQYSPYVYYNEHCIVLSEHHTPMKIDRHTFVRLLDFVDLFPHYILGSNADLPIVGGSILTHEHYQGGRYTFAMAQAPLRTRLTFRGYEGIRAGIVNWPLSVIRISGPDKGRLTDLADHILKLWRGYSDEENEILAYSGDTPHNTITPIARRRGSDFELDLVLRNNRTTDQYPLGIFHPHQELHHIKKENIGLIEVMGLAVLPARLLGEMELLEDTILAGRDVRSVEALAPHADWAEQMLARHPEFAPQAQAGSEISPGDREAVSSMIRDEIGLVFAQVLEHCGVFKNTEKGNRGFASFARTAGAV